MATHMTPAVSHIFVCKVLSDEPLFCACCHIATLKIGRTVRAS